LTVQTSDVPGLVLATPVSVPPNRTCRRSVLLLVLALLVTPSPGCLSDVGAPNPSDPDPNNQPPGVPDSPATSPEGLTIHAAEFTVARGHAIGNHLHPYAPSHAFLPYVLPPGNTGQPAIVENSDGSYSVFFTHLEELLRQVVDITHHTGQKVAVLNIHSHGLPGTTVVPRDAATLASSACDDWRKAYSISDAQFVNDAYSSATVPVMTAIEAVADLPDIRLSLCASDTIDWQHELDQVPELRHVFVKDAQIHVLACVVGRGVAGEIFSRELARQLFGDSSGSILTSFKFGLGDWSMPLGMGFWDIISSQQAQQDLDTMAQQHEVASVAQKGPIRAVKYDGSTWSTTILPDRSVMPMKYEAF
jgi:hypothetical protein